MSLRGNFNTTANSVIMRENNQLRVANEDLQQQQEIWNYYQTLVKDNGFDGVTDLLAKHKDLQQRLVQKDLETLALREALEIAVGRIEDMLKADDGQAWKETERRLPTLKLAISTTYTTEHLDAWLKEKIGEPVIWLTEKEYNTLKRAQKTERETVPLYAVKGLK